MNIVMGNDEFILYIRKQYPNCRTSNDTLGRQLWERIEKNGLQVVKKEENKPCYWEATGTFISEDKLPKTAAQFSFDSSILPMLYKFLDDLGKQR